MKNKKVFAVAVIVVLSVIGLISFKFLNNIKHPFNAKTGKIPVFVHKGDSLFNVISDLNTKGVIKNEYLIKFYIKNKELDTNIKPGKYLISNDVSIKEFVEILNEGKMEKNSMRITIPEGYDIERIANIMDESGIISKNEFLKSCKEYTIPSFIKAEKDVRYALEGYLFPDTYEFEKGITGEKILDIMLSRFEKVIEDIGKEENKKIDNLQELITVASIIEKEARVDEDRAKIASVFYNRLNKGMKLQVDATVLYALEDHRRLSLKDLKVESPYNTYTIKGLPPGPICSPGIACIKAALNPENTDFIYYVLQDKKKHYFTNNYKEFLKAKSLYKKQIK
ncbi:endolytic transglycosylase MltG [Clostridium ganghwense]|uniref:Endolytic murein transglycosylase n=1 Tax=Clostridium ganghwense TaxID=312089 RepID=A0ABT4CTC2_9CLOT|nr:endolytic transglycosylase MltG [Clostridium ganghwense]MCY6372323.1 endolytic transglycosylase MltG [Clostridium ganghwense]